MTNKATAKYFRNMSRVLMATTAICLFVGIVGRFSYEYLAFFGGMASGFLLADALFVWALIGRMV